MSPVSAVYDGRVAGINHVEFIGSAGNYVRRVSYRLEPESRIEFVFDHGATPEGPWTLHSRATLTH